MHIHRYERAWLGFSIGLVFVFFLAVITAAVAGGIQVPSPAGQVNPSDLSQTDFAQPGLRELSPGHYEAYLLAQTWTWNPNEIRIPAGSKLTIYATSGDVQHGLKVEGTNLNAMVVPGQVTQVAHTFDTPGEYLIVCHEYCGNDHHRMSAKIIVEAAPATE